MALSKNHTIDGNSNAPFEKSYVEGNLVNALRFKHNRTPIRLDCAVSRDYS
jgi:hypothetical protein